MKIGLQLYTVRDPLEKDLLGGLDKIAAIGFKNMELAGLYGKSAAEIKKAFDDRGLKAVSTHVGIDACEKHFDQTLEDAKTFGYNTVIVPWIDIKAYPGGWPEFAARLNDIGAKFAEHGITFGYHNHDFEFAPVGDTYGFELLWQHTNPKLVHAELDLAWITKPGHSAVDWINRLNGQVVLCHFKDIDAEGNLADVGKGRIDWAPVIQAAKDANVQYAIIEHDNPGDAFASIEASHKHLVSLGLTD
ncbi:MAG: sugar phosphate isomerase/epimerase [Armatimonadetes bacterium]|nr:sugar phosphate isomerase/epimerase [Armatimonadota bacterium]